MKPVRRVFFPLDKQLQVWDSHWSEGVARQAVWLAGIVTFGEAAEIMQEIGQINISKSSVWRRVEHWGEVMRAEEERAAQAANTAVTPKSVRAQQPSDLERLGVGMDGALIHILGEGWKELKVGCIFQVIQKAVLDKSTLEMEMLGHATHNTYVAHLGGPEKFGQLLWAEAQRRDWEQAVDTQAIGDGAAWIWNLVMDYFYSSHPLVDWYHGTQHLALAAQHIYGEDSLAKQRWWNQQKLRLFQGDAHQIARLLRQRAMSKSGESQAALQQEAGYFENNQHRMNYMETREDGWVIGSGMVESGAKQYKDRFSGPGMRWSRSGAERLIPVRSAVMSGTFHQTWMAAYNSPKF